MRLHYLLLTSVLAGTLAACGAADTSADEPATAAADTQAPDGEMDVSNGPPPPADGSDALVPGTDYQATTMIPCGFDGAAPAQQCDAGVKRNWGETGQHLVEVTKPDGMKRAIFFKGTDAYGADSSQADGSAAWDFDTTRDGDEVTIKFGPETYVVFDALLTGG